MSSPAVVSIFATLEFVLLPVVAVLDVGVEGVVDVFGSMFVLPSTEAVVFLVVSDMLRCERICCGGNSVCPLALSSEWLLVHRCGMNPVERLLPTVRNLQLEYCCRFDLIPNCGDRCKHDVNTFAVPM